MDEIQEVRRGLSWVRGGWSAVALLSVIKSTRIHSILSHEVFIFDGGDAYEQRFCGFFRDIIPFHPVTIDSAWLAWNEGIIPRMAQTIYDDRTFDRLPVLADALEDAGCSNGDLLAHCRQSGDHLRGCWAVDLVLGKK